MVVNSGDPQGDVKRNMIRSGGLYTRTFHRRQLNIDSPIQPHVIRSKARYIKTTNVNVKRTGIHFNNN